jgi:citrate lyase subunit beta/citryl-CoA lyase
MRARRSCLSVPGSRSKMLAKAAGLPADEIVVDLEDSVSPGEKTDATRERVARAFLEHDWVAQTLAVRVNAVATPWCMDDVSHVVRRAGARLDCIVLPKVEAASDVQLVAKRLAELEAELALGRQIGIEALIESARGLVQVESIAAASDRLEALVFGTLDYAASLGMPQPPTGADDRPYVGDPWHYPRSRLIVAARACGLQAVDGPHVAVHDLDGFRRSAQRSASLGYDGKLVLHPEQIGPANDCYSPTAEAIASAERLLAAYERVESGVMLTDGQMVDQASTKLARGVLARGHAPAPPEGAA